MMLRFQGKHHVPGDRAEPARLRAPLAVAAVLRRQRWGKPYIRAFPRRTCWFHDG
ncbi:hypothetical protein HHL10_20990 [Azohydromonas sp. G-1-1-14]|uniref:Uncharacterized protein n=1 Tax=Azohydromonas caseinilytica TaxID=2728836 RepID=A0A848FGY4_9BURK|nr:hypothetical protein [Azohydromonas caseinilytica]